MSAVSNSVMPASSAAPTTASVSLRPMRMPKLLQPSPTTLTLNEPIVRVSTANSLPAAVSAATDVALYCTGDFRWRRLQGLGGRHGRRRSGRDGASSTGQGVGEGRRLRWRGGVLPRHRLVP